MLCFFFTMHCLINNQLALVRPPAPSPVSGRSASFDGPYQRPRYHAACTTSFACPVATANRNKIRIRETATRHKNKSSFERSMKERKEKNTENGHQIKWTNIVTWRRRYALCLDASMKTIGCSSCLYCSK